VNIEVWQAILAAVLSGGIGGIISAIVSAFKERDTAKRSWVEMQLKQKQETINNLRGMIDEHQEERIQLRDQVAELRKVVEKQEKVIDAQQKTIGKQQQQIEEQQKQIAQLEDQSTKMSQENATLEKEASEQRHGREVLTERIVELGNENKNLHQHIKELQRRVNGIDKRGEQGR
jgi:chromosome segregation ATPase